LDPRRVGARVAAGLLFCLAVAIPFSEIVRSDPSDVVPIFPRIEAERPESSKAWFWQQARTGDQIFVAWLVSRNARTLLNDPRSLYQSEQCHPAPTMLALGEPMLALAVLAIPAHLATGGDPLATYNFTLIAMTLIAAFAMSMLVTAWSGSLAAGTIAGLLYAFAPVKLFDITHPYVNDTMWTVFALFFVHRHFAKGRMRDALAAAVFCLMQIAGNFYAVLGATFLAIPLLAWLLREYGTKNLSLRGTGSALGLLFLAAAAIYSPYLALADSPEMATRTLQSFEQIDAFLPALRPGPEHPRPDSESLRHRVICRAGPHVDSHPWPNGVRLSPCPLHPGRAGRGGIAAPGFGRDAGG